MQDRIENTMSSDYTLRLWCFHPRPLSDPAYCTQMVIQLCVRKRRSSTPSERAPPPSGAQTFFLCAGLVICRVVHLRILYLLCDTRCRCDATPTLTAERDTLLTKEMTLLLVCLSSLSL